ncbi:GspH/FimT family pseudopilin [Pseudomonas fragi]|jgi:Tfp pilus assembly protein FimT|uniref:GspH/FimT family pseudopilin n=1 Tax=Pseudomonas fragi TaxID=296 RepID=UPI0020CEA1B6|nr:GspH/FimT family protein [Pseudomonas fragi]
MHQRGMSLIQLLLTLTIVALTARFASPAYSALVEHHQRQITAEQLASSLRNARAQALLRQQFVVVYPHEEDWSRGWRTILDLSGQGHLDKGNPVLVESQGSGRIPIAGNTPVKRYVRFNPLGEPQLIGGAFQAGTLHVCQARTAQSHYQVVLAKSGRISLRSDKTAQALCRHA